jgi:DNA modification methylase
VRPWEGEFAYDKRNVPGLKPKDLCGIPWRVALALQADGWYLRSAIIWHKPNPMPESVNGWRWERCKAKTGTTDKPLKQTTNKASYDVIDGGNGNVATWQDCPGCPKCEPNDGYILRYGAWRPSKAHEYLFLLAKSERYYCDAEAVREGAPNNKNLHMKSGRNFDGDPRDKRKSKLIATGETPPTTRNRRTVWTIATQSYSGAHYATFPEALVEPCIKAGTSEAGVCPDCGGQWARAVERETPSYYQERKHREFSGRKVDGNENYTSISKGRPDNSGVGYGSNTTLGFRPTCTCPPHTPIPATVLDIFAGSGTTGVVCQKLGRSFVGLDLSMEYLSINARERLTLTALDEWQTGKPEQSADLTDLPMFTVPHD